MASRTRFKIFKEALKREGDGTLRAYEEFLKGKKQIKRKSVDLGRIIVHAVQPFAYPTSERGYFKVGLYQRSEKLHSELVSQADWKEEYGLHTLEALEQRQVKPTDYEGFDPAEIIVRRNAGRGKKKKSAITGRTYSTYAESDAWTVPFGSAGDRLFYFQAADHLFKKLMVAAEQKNIFVNVRVKPEYFVLSKT
ncbi:MAG: hypothetical protein QXV73_05640 [Candidatus Micrarchaeia archaeon]